MPQVRTVRINGEALRALRTSRGLSAAKLARMIGRHYKTVSRLEWDETKLASEVLACQLAIALKVDVSEFAVTEGAEDDAEPSGAAA